MLLTLSLALSVQATPSRFLPVSPLSGLPMVKIDQRWAGGSFADDLCRKQGLQGRVMWVDGTANLDSFGTEQKAEALVDRLADAGFNTMVLDVKPIVGRTLYPSKLADQMTSWRGKSMQLGFDPVAVMRKRASSKGLSFFVSLNAFSEGHSYAKRDEGKPDSQFGDAGWGYKHPDLQSVVYRTDGTFRRSGEEQTQIPLMMNPHHPEVQARVLAFVQEVVSRYKPDGLLFDDRYRYHGLDADFSDLTRGLFEKSVKRELSWPEDIFTWTKEKGVRPGPYFDAWLAWRAQTLAEFARRVRTAVHKSNPATQFGIYAGSWYGDYAKYGSNFASSALQAGFPFLTRSYQQGGFAGQLDVLMTGCYYKVPTMYEAMGLAKPIGQTVEAAGDVSNRVARDQCLVYAGIQMVDFANDVAGFERALQAAAATSQGVMVFDYSHDYAKFEGVFQRAFRHPKKAPHQVPGFLTKVRALRNAWDAKGYPQRPFPILEGAPGTGF